MTSRLYADGPLLVAVRPRWWGATVELRDDNGRPLARHRVLTLRRPAPARVAQAYIRHLERITP